VTVASALSLDALRHIETSFDATNVDLSLLSSGIWLVCPDRRPWGTDWSRRRRVSAPCLDARGRIRGEVGSSHQFDDQSCHAGICVASSRRDDLYLSVTPYWPEIFGLVVGGVISAAHGARPVQALTSSRLVQVIAFLLAAIGILLLIEALNPFSHVELLPTDRAIRLIAGSGLGIIIGLVSSMLGVAGASCLSPLSFSSSGSTSEPLALPASSSHSA
jgi:hypothetical protein